VIGGKWWKPVNRWLHLLTESGHQWEWLEVAYETKTCNQDFAVSLIVVVGNWMGALEREQLSREMQDSTVGSLF